MKAARDYPILTVTAKGTRWLESGHPWVYDSDVAREPDESECENGALVDVVSEKGKYLGTGFLSRLSKLRVRIVSRNANDRFDENFWRRRVRYAWDYRKAVMDGQTGCCRLIFGEADAFPGLTVDRFENLLVTQTLSLGMEKIKDMLFPLIVEVLEQDGETIDGLFERNDVVLREKEGLTQNKGWFPLPGKKTPESPITEICENGVFYRVDVENGQKTGFFLDQKFNRLAVAHLAHGKRVLDCFTHTGSFALNAAKGGAEHVTAVDVSESAIEMARANAARNGLEDKMDFLAADVFDLLQELLCRERRFVAGDGFELIDRAARVAEAPAGHLGHLAAETRDNRCNDQRRLVADAAGGVLVDGFVAEPAQVHRIARAHHRIGQDGSLMVGHTLVEHRHGKGGHLVIGDGAVRKALDDKADLVVGQDAAVTLLFNEIDHSHG